MLKIRIAVLVSGKGTTLQYLWSRLRRSPHEPFEIAMVLADRECPAIRCARMHGIPNIVVYRRFAPVFDREAFTKQVAWELQGMQINLVAMAGFRTILGPAIFEPCAYGGRVLNSHPSLLPLFPGIHAVRDTLAFTPRPKETGCTIFFADEGMDMGKIIAQARVPVLEDDTEESLLRRIQGEEHPLYYDIIHDVAEMIREWE